MKISAWHKSRGDIVELVRKYEALEKYDLVYISKVFIDTEIPMEQKDKSLKTIETVGEYYSINPFLQNPNIKYGGTGFFYDKAHPLPDEIEHSKPDYDLYTEWVQEHINFAPKNKVSQIKKKLSAYIDYSIGFTTRGCIRGCSFCVNKNYRKCVIHSPVEEFLDKSRKYICLLDDNVFSCVKWKEVFNALQSTGKRFQFKQGCDERLLTEEKCVELFEKSKWIGDYIFAFDNIEDRHLIEKNIQLIRKRKIKGNIKFYVFCGYNHSNPGYYDESFWIQDITDTFERIAILASYGCLPYIMRYKDYDLSPHRGMYVTIARWCNQPSLFKKYSFREFCEKHGGDSSPMRYMKEFEHSSPRIAANYYDTRYYGTNQPNVPENLSNAP